MTLSAGYPAEYRKMPGILKALFHRPLNLPAHHPTRISKG